MEATEQAEQVNKPKRGRPKGSKNKTDSSINNMLTPETSPTIPSITIDNDPNVVSMTNAADEMPEFGTAPTEQSILENMVNNDVKEINYESFLADSDYSKEKGIRYIPLKALEKLASIKGWTSIDLDVIKPIVTKDLTVTVKCTVTWKDGTRSCGLGDAHTANVEGDYALYLTTVAETRAFARALRKGLRISTCAHEEIAPDKTVEDLDALKGISDAQKNLINRLLSENQMDFMKIVMDFEIQNVQSLDDLNMVQATKLIKWLQSKKGRKNSQL